MRLRTGASYLDGLRDSRDVWSEGKRVESVPDHPAFQGCLRSLSEVYDAQHDPELRDDMTTKGDSGREGLAWMLPRTADDLRRRRAMIEKLARRHGGAMGRLPDYVPLVLWGLMDAQPTLTAVNPEWAANLTAFYEHCHQNDLCLSHSFTDPQIDRGDPTRDRHRLRIVEQTRDGIVVSGAKTVATLAPFADEYLVLTPPRRGLTDNQALVFAIPIATPGLRLICRRSFASPDGPLASRHDEMDAWAVFDRVHVPANRIFLAGDIHTIRRIWRTVTVWTHYQILARMAVKAEVFLGVGGLITETIGTRGFQNVREDLGNMIRYLETLRAFLTAAEAGTRVTPAGLALPDPRVLAVGHLYAIEHFPHLVRLIVELSGHSLLMAPGPNDLAHPETRADFERHFGGEQVDDRARLFRLAWDLACSDFAGRQLLFESFNARSVVQNRLALFDHYDLSSYQETARRLAGMTPTAATEPTRQSRPLEGNKHAHDQQPQRAASSRR